MKTYNKQILKNTIFLYIRTIIVTFVSLFTVRVILKALGEDDYGTYNVVSGFVAMFTFVTGVMINSSQRHFAIYLANDDWEATSRLFSVNLIIYLFYIVFLLILAETVGLWFVINKLNYAPEATTQVIWVYQFSIITVFFSIISSPFIALLIANEHMFVYSVVAILEACGKIAIAFALSAISSSRMMFYGLFLMIVAIGINSIYILYAIFKYKQLHIYFVKDKAAYKEVFAFLNWNLIGGSASALKGQGINIVMNISFGSSINSARSIAYQVSSAISSFSQNFMKAMDPRIIKSYTLEDKTQFNVYVCSASKLSYYLLMVLCLPFIFNSEYVMDLWLDTVPNYTIIFVVLVLVESMILSITDPLLTGVQATGKVKWYQIIVGGLALLNLPFSYLFIVLSDDPLSPFFVAIGIAVLITIARIVIFKRLVREFSVTKYLVRVLLPMIIITSIVSVIDYFLFGGAKNFGYLVLNCFCSLVISLILIFVVGTTKGEKNAIINIIKRRKDGKESDSSQQN